MVSVIFITLGIVLVLAGSHANEYQAAIQVQDILIEDTEITYDNLARNPEDF